MMTYQLALLAVGALAAYLLVTGGFDIGENLQFLMIGMLAGAVRVFVYMSVVS